MKKFKIESRKSENRVTISTNIARIVAQNDQTFLIHPNFSDDRLTRTEASYLTSIEIGSIILVSWWIPTKKFLPFLVTRERTLRRDRTQRW